MGDGCEDVSYLIAEEWCRNNFTAGELYYSTTVENVIQRNNYLLSAEDVGCNAE